MKQKRFAWILVGLPAACLLLLFVLPMIGMIVFSFRGGTFGMEREIFTLENYQAFLQNTSFQRLLARSIWIAAGVSLLSVVLSYPVAYFLAYQAGLQRLSWLTVLLVPAWTSYLLRILAWKLILSSGGLLNVLLLQFGIIREAQPILLYTQGAVMITLVYAWIPFVVMPIFAALDRVDQNLLEAAADLGSPPWRSFLRITLPLSIPGAIAGFFIVFIPTLGEWVTPQLVGGVRGMMYGNAIQDEFVRALNWPMGSVMSVVLLIMVLLLLLLFSRVGRLTDLAGV